MAFHSKLWYKVTALNHCDKADVFVRVCDGTMYFVIIDPEKYDSIDGRFRFLISLKSGIMYLVSHNYVRIKRDLYDALALENALSLHYVIILLKSVFNKNQNYYDYIVFSEKCSNQLAKILNSTYKFFK